MHVCQSTIQPKSAVRAKWSSGCTSKTFLTMSAAYREVGRYPLVVWTTPLGLLAEQKVYEDHILVLERCA